jgi:Peptidase C39 family
MLQDLLNFSGRRRLPVYLQTEAAECGLACLAMIASFHRYRVDLNTLRRRFPVSLKGVTLKALMQIAEQLQLNRVYFENRSFSSSGSRRSLTHSRSATAQGSALTSASKAATRRIRSSAVAWQWW